MTATLRKPKTSAHTAKSFGDKLAAAREASSTETLETETPEERGERFAWNVRQSSGALSFPNDGIEHAGTRPFAISPKVAEETIDALTRIIDKAGSIRQFILDGEYHLQKQAPESVSDRVWNLGITETDPQAVIKELLDRLDGMVHAAKPFLDDDDEPSF